MDFPTGDFAFHRKQGGFLKFLTFFLITLSFLSFAFAAPTDAESISLLGKRNEPISLTERELADSYSALLPPEIQDIALPKTLNDDEELRKRQSAGLFWGPHKIGNLKLYLTNPHTGYAGPKFPNANHVNFHVDKEAARNTYKSVVNMHIVKYHSGGKFCLYAWDSVTSTTVFDNCFDDFAKAIPEAVGAVKDFVSSLLRNADFFASFVIIAALIVALAAALASLGAVAVA